MDDFTFKNQNNNIDFLEAQDVEGPVLPAEPDKFVGGNATNTRNQSPERNRKESPTGNNIDRGRLAKVRQLIKNEWSRLFEAETPPPQESRTLEPHESIKIDLDLAETVREKFDHRDNVVARVEAGNKLFKILDIRDSNLDESFLITDDNFDPDFNDTEGFKKVVKNIPVVIGRQHHTDKFDYPPTVSADHFRVKYTDEGFFIQNLKPTNKTHVRAYMKDTQPESMQHPVQNRPVEQGRTYVAEQRVREGADYREADADAPYGYYMDHPIIGRNSASVKNGVYLGGSAREAIVVDSKSATFENIYGDIEQTIHNENQAKGKLADRYILQMVMEKVKQVMPYDAEKTDQLSAWHYGDKLINLSDYVNAKAGVCRHQALLAAQLVEGLIQNRFLHGSIGVERNTVEDLGGTHAWAIFKPSSGEGANNIVVDASQTFVGTKQQAQVEKRWQYRLSTDQY